MFESWERPFGSRHSRTPEKDCKKWDNYIFNFRKLYFNNKMAEQVEKTKQGHKMKLHTTEPGKNQEVFTPQDLLCGLLSTWKTVRFSKSFWQLWLSEPSSQENRLHIWISSLFILTKLCNKTPQINISLSTKLNQICHSKNQTRFTCGM